jgi:predicted  nucleic acid-binding Zn-ribbon protein
MHNCVRCGRAAASLEEINNGCPCGSKVFVFNKEAVEESKQQETPSAPASPPQEQVPIQPSTSAQPMVPANNSAAAAVQSIQKEKKDEADGKAPESYFARATFTSEDVENIKILREGVFLVDIKALSQSPVVLKDEEGVYYVKLPFEGSGKINGKALNGGNGKDGF